jgi:hypothetical protein
MRRLFLPGSKAGTTPRVAQEKRKTSGKLSLSITLWLHPREENS